MRQLPDGLQAHLDSGATTLAWCWRIERRDGVRLGFTDHDQPLSFDGTTFEAATGFTASEFKTAIGLAVDSVDIASALRSDSLDEDDLAAGLFDDARVEIFRVNWQDTTQRLLMRTGSIGEVRRSATSFTAEIRGLAHYLQQPRGRTYQRVCDADLGDARCTVDLEAGSHRAMGTVISATDDERLVVDGISAIAADRFTRGVLAWTTGPNAGQRAEIKRHEIIDGQVLIELWQTPARSPLPGDGFTATVGCDKTFPTCRDVFSNVDNFRGFPHIPGSDFVTFYPSSGDTGLSGQSQWASGALR